jgi:hypothetical protein
MLPTVDYRTNTTFLLSLDAQKLDRREAANFFLDIKVRLVRPCLRLRPSSTWMMHLRLQFAVVTTQGARYDCGVARKLNACFRLSP